MITLNVRHSVSALSVFLLIVKCVSFISIGTQRVTNPGLSPRKHFSLNSADTDVDKDGGRVYHSLEIERRLTTIPGEVQLKTSATTNSASSSSGSCSNNSNKSRIIDHYYIPVTSLESLRKRYGARKSVFGDWTNQETRQFYKQQLPRSLQIDGALNLTLEERAKLAAEARRTLRLYSRERCHLPGRVVARLYDGLRHLQMFGYWNTEGMSWKEVKDKYSRDARAKLGPSASQEDIELEVYRRIIDRACATNKWFDDIAVGISKEQLVVFLLKILQQMDVGAGIKRGMDTSFVLKLILDSKLIKENPSAGNNTTSSSSSSSSSSSTSSSSTSSSSTSSSSTTTTTTTPTTPTANGASLIVPLAPAVVFLSLASELYTS